MQEIILYASDFNMILIKSPLRLGSTIKKTQKNSNMFRG